jgi:hypothetical protein
MLRLDFSSRGFAFARIALRFAQAVILSAHGAERLW